MAPKFPADAPSDIRLLVSLHTDRGSHGIPSYRLLDAYVVAVTAEGVMNLQAHGYRDDHPWANIHFTAQLDERSDSYYGPSIIWDEFKPKLGQVERAVKSLRFIEKQLSLIDGNFGYADTVAQQLIRFANVLRISSYGSVPENPGASRHDQLDYRWTDAEGIRSRILHDERQWREAHNKEEVTSS